MPQSNVSNSRVPANERAEGVVMHRLALLFVASALWAAQPEPDDAQVWMKKGTEAFDSGHYAEAARDFEKAVARDPASMEARLNLATSYFEQYIPGAHTPNNLDMARKTEENFLKVLDFDAENKSATAYLARISSRRLRPQSRRLKDRRSTIRRATGTGSWPKSTLRKGKPFTISL